MTDKMQITKVA